MKLIIVAALALVAVVAAAPAKEGPPVQLVKSVSETQPNGGYGYAWETDDGSVRQETGELKEVKGEDDKPHAVLIVRGSYGYVVPETGEKISITYTADENGYHPEGDSIPKPARR